MSVRLDSSDVGAECIRYDLVRFSPRTTRTPQGFLKSPAFFTRVGVFEYERADGTKIRELRPEEEVFHEDSLATLCGAPLVRDHPTEGMVTPENARKLSIGWASEKVERKDSMVSGMVTIMDGQAIEDIAAGKLREISMGYRCRIDSTPGVDPVHGKYDQVQRSIRYNHVALGGIQWGRAGSEVGLRLDSRSAVRCDAFTQAEHLIMQKADLLGLNRETLAEKAGVDIWALEEILFGFGRPKRATVEKVADALGIDVEILLNLIPRVDAKEDPKMETIKIGGVEIEVSKTAAQVIQGAIVRHDSEVSKLKEEKEALQGRLDAQVEELKSTKTKLEKAEDPERLDSLVSSRIDLITKARKVLGDAAEIKGTPREIQEMVLKHDRKDLDLADKSDAYVEARFDAAIESFGTSAGNMGTVRADAKKAASGEGRIDSEKSREEMKKRNAEAWKQPLAIHQ